VLSAGGALRIDAQGVSVGALERLWWGVRSYNYHAPYSLSVGVFVEARQFPGPQGDFDVVAGADLDLQVFALPWLMLYTWIFKRDPGR
jgi:hypothetical protein